MKKYILSLLVDDSGNARLVYVYDIYPAMLERYKSKGKTISLEEVQKLLDDLVSEGLVEKIEDKYKITDAGKKLL